jgi:type IV secretion system protein VirB5
MLKLLRMTVISLSIILPHSVNAQIPTTDIVNNITHILNQTQDMAQWAEQISSMYEQIKQMEKQYSQMEKEYERITGSRNLGDILNDPIFRNYLPEEWRDLYDATRHGGYASLTGDAKDLYEDNQIFDMCSHLANEVHRKSCESQAIKGAQDQTFATTAYEAATNRVDQIEGLMAEINGTDDPKGIAELQARIAVEQATIQNEQTKLAMFQMIANAEKEIQTQRLREAESRTWSAEGRIEVNPISFDNQEGN